MATAAPKPSSESSVSHIVVLGSCDYLPVRDVLREAPVTMASLPSKGRGDDMFGYIVMQEYVSSESLKTMRSIANG